MTWLVLLALAGTPLKAPPPAKGPAPVPIAVDFGVQLCTEGDALGPAPDVRPVLRRVLEVSLAGRTVGIKRQTCGDQMPDATCFGVPGGVLCRLPALSRMLRAVAWMSAMRGAQETYESFRLRQPRAVYYAFRFAEGATANAQAESAIASIVAAEAEEAPEPSAPDVAFAPTYRRIAELTLAALLGHEVAHGFDDRCPLASPSRFEESGDFRRVVAVDMSGELFCRHAPLVEEVQADRCALRHLRQLAARVPTLLSPGDEEFSRRVSADLIAFQVLAGWRRWPGTAPGEFSLVRLDGYLEPPLRLLLLAGEVGSGLAGPPVCGEAASLFVHGVQEGFRACRDGGGIVSDPLLALLPKGVEKSWSGAPWTPASVSCSP